MSDSDMSFVFGSLVVALLGVFIGIYVGSSGQESTDEAKYPCAVKCGGWEKARLEDDVCFCREEVKE